MPTTFVLDTDVCVDILRGRGPAAGSEAEQTPLAASAISSITLAELEVGIAKVIAPGRPRRRLDEFLEQVAVIDFDAAAASHYGEIRAHLEKKGAVIGPLDTLIAAHARSRSATLVTANLKEFRRVPGLKCIAWKRVAGPNR